MSANPATSAVGALRTAWLLAAACVPDEEAPDVAEDLPDEPVEAELPDPPDPEPADELRFAWWGDERRHRVTDEIIRQFEIDNPDTVVIPEFADAREQFVALLDAELAADETLGVIEVDGALLRQLAGDGTLLDLGEHVEEPLGTADIEPQALATGEIDGVLYGVPWAVDQRVVVVNTDLLADTDVEIPDEWTWEEFGSIAQQLSEETDEGVYGAADPGAHPANLEAYVAQHDQALFADGELAVSEQDLSDWAAQVVEWRDAGATAPAAAAADLTADREVAGSAIAGGTAVMELHWVSDVGALEEATDVELEVRPVPGDVDQATTFLTVGRYLTVAADTAEPEAAARFVDYVVNDIRANELGLADRGAPAREDARLQVIGAVEQVVDDALVILHARLELGAPVAPADPVGGHEARGLYRELYEEVQAGMLEVDEAAARFVDEAPQLLGQ